MYYLNSQSNYTLRSKTLLKLNTESKMTSIKVTDDKIIWMDLEMTGLEIEKDVIMEIGCIITEGDPNLKEIARSPSYIIHVPHATLNSMTSWCIATHNNSGLTDACRKSSLTTDKAESQLLEFLQEHTEKGKSPLAGNSLTYDRLFMKKYMPKVYAHLHYRNIDVSTIKEIVRRWYPDVYQAAPKKKFVHKSISDIEESIGELKYYQSAVFLPIIPL